MRLLGGFLGPSSLQVRGLGLILVPIWSILGRSWLQVGRSWPDFGSKLDAKMLQKSILRRSDKVFFWCSSWAVILSAILYKSGSDLGAKTVPKWSQIGIKIHLILNMDCRAVFWRMLAWFWLGFVMHVTWAIYKNHWNFMCSCMFLLYEAKSEHLLKMLRSGTTIL